LKRIKLYSINQAGPCGFVYAMSSEIAFTERPSWKRSLLLFSPKSVLHETAWPHDRGGDTTKSEQYLTCPLDLSILPKKRRNLDVSFAYSWRKKFRMGVAGTLYPLLRRLERDRLVRADWTEPYGGPPRKVYTLSEPGSKRLRELTAVWRQLISDMSNIVEVDLS